MFIHRNANRGSQIQLNLYLWNCVCCSWKNREGTPVLQNSNILLIVRKHLALMAPSVITVDPSNYLIFWTLHATSYRPLIVLTAISLFRTEKQCKILPITLRVSCLQSFLVKCLYDSQFLISRNKNRIWIVQFNKNILSASRNPSQHLKTSLGGRTGRKKMFTSSLRTIRSSHWLPPLDSNSGPCSNNTINAKSVHFHKCDQGNCMWLPQLPSFLCHKIYYVVPLFCICGGILFSPFFLLFILLLFSVFTYFSSFFLHFLLLFFLPLCFLLFLFLQISFFSFFLFIVFFLV